MILENYLDQEMVMCTHRYCLGRQTYVVQDCIEWLRATWPQIEGHTRHIVLRDTVEELARGHAGGHMDARAWGDFMLWALERTSDAQLATLRESVQHGVASVELLDNYARTVHLFKLNRMMEEAAAARPAHGNT